MSLDWCSSLGLPPCLWLDLLTAFLVFCVWVLVICAFWRNM